MANNRTLWILEDNPDLLQMAIRISSNLGFRPVPFSSLAAAWRATDAWCPQTQPNYLVSDFHLPDGTSLNWLTHVRRHLPQSRLGCVSGALPAAAAAHLKSLDIAIRGKPQGIQELLKSWVQQDNFPMI